MAEDSLRSEFQCSNLSLNHHNPDVFIRSQWPVSRWIYLVWRGAWCLWHLVWIVVSGVHFRENKARYTEESGKWFIYIGNIVFLLTTVTCVLDFVYVLYCTTKSKGTVSGHTTETENTSRGLEETRNGEKEEIIFQGEFTIEDGWWTECSTPWPIKLVWVLYSVINCANVLVTIMHWSVEYDGDADAVDVALHAINLVFVISNLIFTASPVRILHFIYPSIFVAMYFLFNLIYYQAGGTDVEGSDEIFKGIDWTSGFPTAVTIVLGVFVAAPLGHLLMFALYTFRLYIFSFTTSASYSTSATGKVTKTSDSTVPQMISSVYVTGVE